MSTKSQLDALATVRLSEQESDVREALELAPMSGLTNAQLMGWTGYSQNTISSRVSLLREKGIVKDSGRTRENPLSGAQQTVWVLGDDSYKVTRHRLAKLRKLADELGFDLVPR